MNGLLALCHFCELHGPSVIFCTQAFHLHPAKLPFDGVAPPETTAQLDAATTAAAAAATSTRAAATTAATAGNESTDTSNGSVTGSATGDNRLIHQGALTAAAAAAAAAAKSSTCNSCASVPEGERGYVTNDYEAHTTYLSTRNPINSKLYSIVRQACVQSLSCEINPGREGPVMFGDEQNGYVLSYMFKIRDSQARGMMRHYSFILLMTDRIFLVASWPFLVSNFRHVAMDIQQKAERTYDRDVAQRRKEAASSASFVRTAPLYSDQYLRRRSGQSLRTLVDLMGSQDFFAQLHACCSWILKSSGSRLYEKQLAGPPLIGTAPTPTPVVHDSMADSSQLANGNCGYDIVANGSHKHNDQFANLCFDNLLELRRILRPESFAMLTYHVTVGNQVIVRGDARSLVVSALNLLKELVPPACASILPYEPSYQESYNCNFLGLPSTVEIPVHVDRSTFIVLDIRYDVYDDYVGNGNGLYVNYDSQNERFRQFFFLVSNGTRPRSTSLRRASPLLEMPVTVNSFTAQLEVIMSLNPSSALLDVQLMTLKEDWISKSKLLFKLSRSVDAEGEDKVKRFIKIVNVKENDLPMLKFWIAGLDRRYRARLLAM